MTAESVTGPLAVAVLAASLVGASSLAARRWGPSVGGALSAFPLIIGPVLFIAAERHGVRFAAETADATLLGLVALAGFALVYAWAAARSGWTASLLLAWVAAAALGAVTSMMELSLLGAGLCAAAAIAAARVGLPATGAGPVQRATPTWDLPVRMAFTALLILLLTAAANRFGSTVAGALSALPAVASILAVCTHRRDGHRATVELLRGTLEGTAAFAAFCAVIGTLLERIGIAPAFLVAIAVALVVQTTAIRARAREPSLDRLETEPVTAVTEPLQTAAPGCRARKPASRVRRHSKLSSDAPELRV